MARRVLGLDLGSHTIKGALFQQALRGAEVLRLAELRRPNPGTDLADEALAPALADWLDTNDLRAETVVISLPGDQSSTRLLTFPFRDRRRLAPAVPFELAEQVPFDLDGFVYDWQVAREDAAQTRVAVTLARRDLVTETLDALGRAGIDPRIVEAEGLVLGNLAEVHPLPGPRLLIDVGHRKTTLCLCQDGRALGARTLALGGAALTEAVARDLGLSVPEAEEAKHADGIFGGPGRAASPAAGQVADRLAREVLRTLGGMEGLLADEPGDEPLRAVLVGGSSRLHRLDAFLNEQTGLETTRLEAPPPSAEPDKGPAALAQASAAAGDPSWYAPALALAARGALRPHTRMNLRQGDLAPRVELGKVARHFRSTAVLAVLALVLGLGVLAVEAAIQGRRAEAVERQALALYQGAFPNRPPPRDVQRGMDQAVRSAQRRADTLGVYRGNLSALDILTEISSRVPADLDVVFEELTIDRRMVQLKGHSPSFGSVDRLRAELARFAPFSEIVVGDITRDARRGGQNFSVRIALEPEGDAS